MAESQPVRPDKQVTVILLWLRKRITLWLILPKSIQKNQRLEITVFPYSK